MITDCLGCSRYRPARYGDCLSCSYLWGGKERNREFVLRSLYHVMPPDSPAMANGRQVHEEKARERGVVESVPDIVSMLQSKAEFSWTGLICSPMHGLRGRPDSVRVSWAEAEDGRPQLTFTVEEDKGHYSSDFWVQLYGYALVLSDPHSLLHNTEGEGLSLYGPIPRPFHVDIRVALSLYSTGVTYGPHVFSSDWRVQNETGENAVLSVRKMRLQALRDERDFAQDHQTRFTTSRRSDLHIIHDLGSLRLMVKRGEKA
jgi:hypothetical protein